MYLSTKMENHLTWNCVQNHVEKLFRPDFQAKTTIIPPIVPPKKHILYTSLIMIVLQDSFRVPSSPQKMKPLEIIQGVFCCPGRIRDFFIMYYVFILKSEVDGTYYKGFTEDYIKRLKEHNAGLSKYTSVKMPWELIYVESHSAKTDAIIREKKIKRCKADYFEWLRLQPSNLLNK